MLNSIEDSVKGIEFHIIVFLILGLLLVAIIAFATGGLERTFEGFLDLFEGFMLSG